MKKEVFSKLWLLLAVLSLGLFVSCTEDDGGKPTEEDPIASFQFEISATNFLEVSFENFSQNATSYSWDFGDGSAASTEESPTHTYAAAGEYDVTLTASNGTVEVTKTETITITDPGDALVLLAGEESKTWKLFREGTSMQLGTAENPGQHWPGLQNNGVRNCLYTHTFTFARDGEYIFDDMGSFWAEFGVFNDLDYYETCFDATPENMILADGTDVSAWLSGTHSYTYDPATGIVTLSGEGAWIGIPKLGTEGETGSTINSTVSFPITIEEHEGYDLMTVKFVYGVDIWTFVYASYSDESLEPDLPTSTPPTAGFATEVDGLSVTFTNNATNADTYSWDFGDGNTSTEAAPTHTYASAGAYTATLTATGAGGNASSSTTMVLGATTATEADIQSKNWKMRGGHGSARVGPGIGSGEWYTTDQAWADAAPCLYDDTFTFNTDGSFVINVQDEAFTEAAMEGIEANGCVAVADLPANLAGWAGGDFTYTFAEAAGDALPTITVTGNGAYIGFYKGANGVELTQPQDGPITYEILSYVDGTDADYMEVAVDISAPQDGTAYWTYLLIAE